MKPYPSYKPSGVAWLGDVPGHWGVERLRFVIDTIESGKSVNAADVPAAPHQLGVLKTSCVYTRAFRAEENKTVVPDETDLVSCPLRLGALIVSRMNTPDLVGAAGLVSEAPDNIYLPDRLWQVVVDQARAKPSYAYWFTRTQSYGDQVRASCSGSSESMQNLAQNKFRDILLTLPTLHEQQAIAAYLDAETTRIDELIREKEGLIDLLDEARRSFVSELLSGDTLPGGPSGNPWAPHLPYGWQIKRLKHLAEVRSGIAKGKDNDGRDTVELPYLRVANVQDGHLALDDVATIAVDVDAVERYSLQPGDVLMNEGGDYDKVGRGAQWHGQIAPCLHQNHVFAVRPVAPEFSDWLAAVTQTKYAKYYFMNNAKQSTNLASISQSNVKELPVLLPPPEERAKLLAQAAQESAGLANLITHTTEEIALLKELRAATIADAVLGRVDVTTRARSTALETAES